MVESKNSRVDLTSKASWFRGIVSYGKIMIGSHAFEFYNERNVNDYVQIPWEEISLVLADVIHFWGRKNYIPRFKICTEQNGDFVFSAHDAKAVLRAMRHYLPEEKLRRSLTVWQKTKNKFRHK